MAWQQPNILSEGNVSCLKKTFHAVFRLIPNNLICACGHNSYGIKFTTITNKNNYVKVKIMLRIMFQYTLLR